MPTFKRYALPDKKETIKANIISIRYTSNIKQDDKILEVNLSITSVYSNGLNLKQNDFQLAKQNSLPYGTEEITDLYRLK